MEEEFDNIDEANPVIVDLDFAAHISSLANVSVERLISRSLRSANPSSRYHAALQELTWLAEKAIKEALSKQSSLIGKTVREPEVEVVYCKLPVLPGNKTLPSCIDWDVSENLTGSSITFSVESDVKSSIKLFSLP